MKKRLFAVSSCLLLISIILSACSQKNADLAGTIWEIYSTTLNGEEQMADEEMQSTFTLVFDSDGTMHSTSGALTGINPKQYEVNGNEVTFTDATETIITATIKGNKMIVIDGEYTSTYQKQKNN